MPTNIGVGAQVGSSLSKPNVVLRDRANVLGSIVTAGVVQRQNRTVVSGMIRSKVAVASSALDCLAVTFPQTNGGDKMLEPGQTVTLAPGAYRNISIKSNATLKLRAGVYYFESLSVEPQGTINGDTATGSLYLSLRALEPHASRQGGANRRRR